MSTFDLTGRRALVTGASRNIGLAICSAFFTAGAELIMVARDSAVLAGAAAAVGPADAVHAVPADVADPRSIDALVEAVRVHWPAGPEIIVNNAYAMGPRSPALDSSEQAWSDCWLANVMAPLRLCQEFVPAMAATGRGSIVNVVSGTGFQVAPGVAAYGVSKAAMWMLTRYLAAECAPAVRCNALMPGMVSDEPEGWEDDPTVSALIAATPMARYGHPDEVAPAALYLASDASTYTTGALLAVNGGRYW
jgi:NAD(P)-dependent dehydrogenase (short-subunit alcohol dehydrogenase family)